MDTVITVTVYDGDEDALDSTMKLCRQYENLFSKTVADSDISKINASNGNPITVSDDTAELIKTALNLAKASDGHFDPTVLPLVEMWNVTERTTPPDEDDIKKAKTSVSYKNIIIDGNTVTAKNGAKLDLGGIAKGYITDMVVEHLKSKNVTSAIINLGGNLYLLGDKSGKEFAVGVQKPFGKNGEHTAIIHLKNKTAVTSGVYQRYFEHNKKIYHHIIDTKTGYPCDNGICSVTVICDSSSIADGLSTACLSSGFEKAKELAKQYNSEFIMITADGSLQLSDGITKETINGETHLKLNTNHKSKTEYNK